MRWFTSGWVACGALLLVALPGAAQDRAGEVVRAERFDVAAGGRLTVDVGDANVDVRTGGTQVEIEIVATGSSAEWAREVYERMDFQISQAGSEVRIQADDPGIRGREWRRNRGAGVTAVVYVPERFDLDVRTGDGNIRVQTIEGRIELFSGDGNLTLQDVVSHAPLSLETRDGNITTQALAAPRIEIRTSDGNVTTGTLDANDTRIRSGDGNVVVNGSRGRIALSTGDGNVTLHLDDFAGAELVSGDGNVVVTAPSDLSADILLSGERLEVGGFAIQGSIDRHRARGTVGGGGPSLQARTSDGRVVLRSAGS